MMLDPALGILMGFLFEGLVSDDGSLSNEIRQLNRTLKIALIQRKVFSFIFQWLGFLKNTPHLLD